MRAKVRLTDQEMNNLVNFIKEATYGPGGTWSMKILEEAKERVFKLNTQDVDKFTMMIVNDFISDESTPLSRFKTAQLLTHLKTKQVPGYLESINKRKDDLLLKCKNCGNEQLGAPTAAYINNIFAESPKPSTNTPPPQVVYVMHNSVRTMHPTSLPPHPSFK